MHGSAGPIPVLRRQQAPWPPIQAALHQAALALGFPADPDMNGPESGGIGAMPMNNPDGIRMSTALTHLNPARHRLNLTIRPNALTRRVLFEGTRAVGVEVESGKEVFSIAGKEIVLSAGGLKSPHLLLLSGVGPAAELPAGAGELRLMSTNPHVQPHFDYHYLEDPWDRQRLREAVRLCLQLAQQKAYADIIAERLAPTDQDLASDDALDTWLLKTLGTARHISGTCKMGPASDPMAVVDQYARVHGLTGLRVADGSILPHVTRANTHATIIMAAERVAEWI